MVIDMALTLGNTVVTYRNAVQHAMVCAHMYNAGLDVGTCTAFIWTPCTYLAANLFLGHRDSECISSIHSKFSLKSACAELQGLRLLTGGMLEQEKVPDTTSLMLLGTMVSPCAQECV